jgi:hypothetical protein
VHAELQQKPSTQCVDVHCASALQALPLPTVPQLPLTHGWPTQSPSPAHVVAHAAPLHLKGVHATGTAGTQLPLPSQLAPVTDFPLVMSQLPPAHTVPLS